MNSNRKPAEGNGGLAIIRDGLPSPSANLHYSGNRPNFQPLQAPKRPGNRYYSPHFLVASTEDRLTRKRGVYVEEPNARRAVSGRYDRVVVDFTNVRGPILRVDIADFARHGTWVQDSTGDWQWCVPMRFWRRLTMTEARREMEKG